MCKKKFLKILNGSRKNTLLNSLGIEFIDYGENYVEARMPVNSVVYQPDGILHGGATAALAETVGSTAASLFSKGKKMVRGTELTINHLKSIKSGYVYAKAIPIHMGRSMQLWEIKINDKNGKIISIAKLTTLTL